MNWVRNVCWVTNLVVLLLVTVVTLASLKTGLVGNLYFNKFEKISVGLKVITTSLTLRVRFGAVQVKWQPNVERTILSKDYRAKTFDSSFTLKEFGYPYAELSFRDNLYRLGEGENFAPSIVNRKLLGFQYSTYSANPNAQVALQTDHWKSITFPYAVALVPWVVLTALSVKRRIISGVRNYRTKRGRCPNCGYQLVPGFVLCSECGESPLC